MAEKLDQKYNALEFKIPPPLVALLIAVAMWGISFASRPFEASIFIREAVALVFVIVGGIIGISGIVALRHAKTTFRPERPEMTSSLVTYGIYRFTRNPMYVGVLHILVAWAVLLESVWAFAGPGIFILYINRFQIVPEERMLASKFGPAYEAYKAEVCRWL